MMFALLFAASQVVARAGGAEITADLLRERIERTRAAGGDARPQLLVQDLVNEALLAEEASRLGLQQEPEVAAAADAERRRAAGERLLETALGGVQVSDDELLELYHSTSDTVRLQLVVLASEAEAKASLERLRGGARLADEALRSLDPQSRESGGEFGARSRFQLPPLLANAAFAAPIGQLTGPVKLDLGFAVLRVVERSLGDEQAFAARRDELRAFAQKQKRAFVRSHYLEQLRKQAKLAVDDDFLRETGTRLTGAPEEMQHVVAKVGSRKVTFADVAAEVRRLFGGKQAGHASGPGVKSEMAWALVDRLLLGDAALQRGLGDDPQVRAAAQAAEREAMVRLLSARIRAQAPRPQPAEIEAYYRSQPAAFRKPARRPCAHILVATREEAARLYGQIARGAKFEELARDFSRDPASAAKGGAIGDIIEERLDALAKSEPDLAAALRTPAGEVSAPAKSRAGWHLIRCEQTIPSAQVPLAEVQASIEGRLAAEKGDEAVRRHIATLRAGARIEVVPDAVLEGFAG